MFARPRQASHVKGAIVDCVLLQLVVDWLEGLARVGLETYPAKAAYFADNVCWENTLHDITHGVDCDVLVTEMVGHDACCPLYNNSVHRTPTPAQGNDVSSQVWMRGMNSLLTSMSSHVSEQASWKRYTCPEGVLV